MANVLMARFDVYLNPGEHAGAVPYLLDVQSDLLNDLESRMAIPLCHLARYANIKIPDRLMPTLIVRDKAFLLETPKMGAAPVRILKSFVISLAHEQAQIVAALDFLFQGY
jgi:toxin CcdB